MISTTMTAGDTIPLPKPDDRLGADIVIFDGDCRFCTAQVLRLRRFDGARRLAFLSLHNPEVVRRFPELQHEALLAEMHVVTADGSIYRGADAFRYLSRKLPRLWWLAPLLHIPGSLPVWRWCYRQIARRRYLFGRVPSCDDGTCRLHDHR